MVIENLKICALVPNIAWKSRDSMIKEGLTIRKKMKLISDEVIYKK